MYIVYVSREYPPSTRGGGIASYVSEIAHGMVSVGNKITVICASDDTCEGSRYDDDGVDVIRLKDGDFVIDGKEPVTIWNRLREVYRFRSYRRRVVDTILKLEDVDIIEVPEFGAESLFFDELNIPHVIRLHTPSLFNRDSKGISMFNLRTSYRYLQQYTELGLIAKAKYVTSCSNDLKEWTISNIKDIKADIKIIYNPVNITPLYRCKRVREKPFILFAGTIIKWKGVEDLINACELLSIDEMGIDLVVAGKEGEFADMLKQRYGSCDWIKFIGKVSHDVLYPMFAEAKVVVFPSWWDNMPMVCIEAMMNGGIVIGSSEGGMKEIITDGKDGYLTVPKNPIELSRIIKTTLDMSWEERSVISKAARERIVSGFSKEVIVEQMIDYYKNVIIDYRNK